MNFDFKKIIYNYIKLKRLKPFPSFLVIQVRNKKKKPRLKAEAGFVNKRLGVIDYNRIEIKFKLSLVLVKNQSPSGPRGLYFLFKNTSLPYVVSFFNALIFCGKKTKKLFTFLITAYSILHSN